MKTARQALLDHNQTFHQCPANIPAMNAWMATDMQLRAYSIRSEGTDIVDMLVAKSYDEQARTYLGLTDADQFYS